MSRLAMCTGCFDILHYGHLRYLSFAASHARMLVVGVTADAFIDKGPGRPVFDERRRAEMLSALRMVNYVEIYHERVPFNLIRKWRPNLYCKGAEYEGRLPEQALVESLGGRVVFSREERHSSTQLVRLL